MMIHLTAQQLTEVLLILRAEESRDRRNGNDDPGIVVSTHFTPIDTDSPEVEKIKTKISETAAAFAHAFVQPCVTREHDGSHETGGVGDEVRTSDKVSLDHPTSTDDYDSKDNVRSLLKSFMTNLRVMAKVLISISEISISLDAGASRKQANNPTEPNHEDFHSLSKTP